MSGKDRNGNAYDWAYNSLTWDNKVDGLLGATRWDEDTLYYSIPRSSDEYYYDIDGIRGGDYFVTASGHRLEDHLHSTLNIHDGNSANDGFSVEGFTNLNIVSTSRENANIRLAFSNSDKQYTDSLGGIAGFPGIDDEDGDVWISDYFIDEAANGIGTQSHFLILHEVGHALGLKHPHEIDTNNGKTFPKLAEKYDSPEYTVMTYRHYEGDAPDGTKFDTNAPQTFMMLDIAALQEMYGADYSTNSGDTVYSWKPGDGDTYVNGRAAIEIDSFSVNKTIFATVWDGGGRDTYDLSAYDTGLEIDLRPGEHSLFSDAQLAYMGWPHDVDEPIYAQGNIYNALLHDGDTRSLIENAKGGSGRDEIRGNQVANQLWGNGGRDFLYGYEGGDTLYGGGDVDVLYGHEGYDWLEGGSNNDYLFGGTQDDVLIGGSGDDRLYGGIGNDNMYGGTGADRFDFTVSRQGSGFFFDVVKDFNVFEGDYLVFDTHKDDVQYYQFGGDVVGIYNDFQNLFIVENSTVLEVGILGSVFE